MMMNLYLLLLLILGLSGVYSDSHTVQYYYTAVSVLGSGLPEFSIVGYVDDQEIMNYKSDSHVARPVAQWMNKEGPEYWDTETQAAKGDEPVFKHNVRTAMSRFNQTGGLHSFQLMYGCEVRDDGSTAGYYQYGYDGREFIYLDTQSGEYIPTMHEAQITTQRWNSPEVRVGERNKNYLENRCIEWLKRYIEHGRDELERRVRPEVKVSGHHSDEVTRLHCQVYGFHPRPVDVKWMIGKDQVPSSEMMQILPNPDGTYQTRVTVEVPAGKEGNYSCHVDHSSLEKPLNVLYIRDPPSSGPSIGMIIGVLIACLVIVIGGIAGFLIYKKTRTDYKTTSTSDTSSDSSKHAVKA